MMTVNDWAERAGSWAGRVWARLPHWLAAAAGLVLQHRLAITLVVVALVAAVVTIRTVAVRRALADRVTLELRPADTFDPSAEQIGRWAAMLARTRRTVRGWAERPGSAVRIQLASKDTGSFTFTVAGPRRARDLLVMAGWPDVEVRLPPDESLAANPETRDAAEVGDIADVEAGAEDTAQLDGNVIDLAVRRRLGNGGSR